jgi:hypothetical protein
VHTPLKARRAHALGEGSVAIDAIPQAECEVDTDQRGQPRPETGGTECDVGAFEVQPWARTRFATCSQTHRLRPPPRDSPAILGFQLARLMHFYNGAY